jgi:hypothetical protein
VVDVISMIISELAATLKFTGKSTVIEVRDGRYKPSEFGLPVDGEGPKVGRFATNAILLPFTKLNVTLMLSALLPSFSRSTGT